MNQQDRKVHTRLRRAEGQLQGVIRMVEQGRACEEVVTQLMAIRTAVDRAAVELIMAHVDDCVAKLPADQSRADLGRAVRLIGKLT